MAERYLDGPRLRARGGGRPLRHPADRIRALAAELARVAFEEEIVIDQPWTDFRGQRHDRMVGRPVSFHAMRGISAHSNGFQTCRALHVLQILLGIGRGAGRLPLQAALPQAAQAHPRPHGACHARVSRWPGRIWASCGGPRICCWTRTAPARIDKAFTWENPMSAHGLMHMVISNAHAGDPYRSTRCSSTWRTWRGTRR
jgi:sulfite dehydrogenase (quinone) subunit SoeA